MPRYTFQGTTGRFTEDQRITAAQALVRLAEACDGASVDCPADVVTTAGEVCRDSAGDCDIAEVCERAGAFV